MDNIDHMYPVSFSDSNNKVNVTIQGYGDTGANKCVLKEGVAPKECLMSLNKMIKLKGLCAGVNTAPMFRANVTSPIVNGDIDVAVVSSECNFPYNSSTIVGEDFNAPYGLIQGFVNVIMNGNQTEYDSEELKECDDIYIYH